PSCANSIGDSPYSLANQHAAPRVSEENHSASRTLTTNQPSITGASPEPASSSLASFTQQILAVQATAVSRVPCCDMSERGALCWLRGAWVLIRRSREHHVRIPLRNRWSIRTGRDCVRCRSPRRDSARLDVQRAN